MALTIANVVAIPACDGVVDRIDTGAGTSVLNGYDATGGVPAGPEVAIGTQVLLFSIDLQNPAFGAAADAAPGGQATLLGVPLSDTSANATGTAAFWRILDRDALSIIQGTLATSGGDINLNTLSIVTAATVEITSLTITMPEA